jgi:hypothetical protein
MESNPKKGKVFRYCIVLEIPNSYASEAAHESIAEAITNALRNHPVIFVRVDGKTVVSVCREYVN